MTTSEKLSSKICITCNSLLARYLALKKCFIENQEKLINLLNEPRPATPVEEVALKLKVLETPAHTYTIVQSIEPFEDEIEIPSTTQVEVVPPEAHKAVQQLSDKSKERQCSTKKSKGKFKTVQKYTTTKGAARLYYCEECNYQCSQNYSLSRHKWKLHNGPEPTKRFICELCSKQFSSTILLNRHLDKHNNVIKLWCGTDEELNYYNLLNKSLLSDRCAFKTHAKPDLLIHLRTHLRGASQIQHRCTYKDCGAVFKWKGSLAPHIRVVHLNDIPFACLHCDKRFVKEKTLASHVKFVHQKFRPFMCDVNGCESVFGIKAHLVRHKKNIHKMAMK